MRKILFALLALLLMVGTLVSCTESAANEIDESISQSVTVTIAEIERSRNGANEPIITTQEVQQDSVIILEAWDHEWWTITIEEIRADYLVLHGELRDPTGEKETERIEIAFGQEHQIATPTYGGTIEWTLLFTAE